VQVIKRENLFRSAESRIYAKVEEYNMKEALPQVIFIVVLMINLCTALMDSNRNFKASLIATTILIALTHWGGFFKPLVDFLISK
jgi:hypothetical protein